MRPVTRRHSTLTQRLVRLGSGLVGGLVLLASGAASPAAVRAAPLLGLAESWGYDLYDETGLGTPFNQSPLGTPLPLPSNAQIGASGVAAGGYHSLALESGHVFGWGRDFEGELGDGTSHITATAVEAQTSAGVNLSGVTAVEAGTWHTLALKSDGTVWAMGSNSLGQLGINSNVDSSFAVEVTKDSVGTALSGITAIAAGGFHSMALDSSGNIWAWGDNGSGDVGDGTTTQRKFAVKLTGLPTAGHKVTDIAAGHDHSLAVQDDGTVWAWGYDGSGQLGDNTTGNGSTSPQHVLNSSGSNLNIGTSSGLAWPLHRLGGGGNHSLALKSDGTVLAWGDNSHGQLGTASTSNNLEAAQVVTTVPGGNLAGVQSVAAGGAHSLSLQSDGTARAWGVDIQGQLGDGTFGDPTPQVASPPTNTGPLSGCFCRKNPVVVVGIVLGFSIAAGGAHSVAAQI